VNILGFALKKKYILWLYLFLFATLADIALIIERSEEYRFFTKPAILLGLILYFYQLSRPIAQTLLSKSILAALIFSWIGDILLLWPDLLIYGLGAFLIAQSCYIIGFKVARFHPGQVGSVNFVRIFFSNLPIYFIAAFIFYMINTNLGGLKIPVAIYMIAVVSMLTMAKERYKNTSGESFWQVFLGASLFFISDTVIALSLFYQDFPESGIIIMGTYATSQLLIVMGIRSHIINPKKNEA